MEALSSSISRQRPSLKRRLKLRHVTERYLMVDLLFADRIRCG
uniref:Uncharacterized protein n=1 Tax=Solanum lycopersicum TaxID=4081 RepID=A0A3Q7JCI2_SOLLC